MSVTQGKLQAKITDLLDILASVDTIVNGHLASFITKNLWTNALPPLVFQELQNLPSLDDFIPLYFAFLSDRNSACLRPYPNLERFIRTASVTSLLGDSSCITQLNQLNNKFTMLGLSSERQPDLKDFMSLKKKHEVEKIVPLAGMLAKVMDASYVVDVGGGKGYLSATMAKQYGLHVVALDSSSVTTCGAQKLELKMAKAASRNSKNLHKFERATVLVARDTDFEPILFRCFGSNNLRIGLVGLHTCGNLAPICLHQFLRDNARWIVNVGCCYHLIDEEFEQGEFGGDISCTSDFGFPLSSFLREKNVKLGRNSRMLAAHCLEKLLHDGINQESAKSLYFRALLQVIVKRSQGHDVLEGRIGRLASKCSDFHQYVRRAVQKLQLDVNLSDADINDLLRDHADDEMKLQVFFLLRIHHAPVIESVILLDRLLFLFEQGIENAYLVPMFDPTVSPRNHAIVAWKSSPSTS